MTAIVPSKDIGIASTTLSVLDTEPRNIQHTSAVRTTAITSSSSTWWTDCSMYFAES